MKKHSRVVLLVLAVVFCATSLFAEEPAKAGFAKYGSETVDSINAAGLVKLQGTTVRQLVQVSGSLLAQSAFLTTLEIYGEANFTGSTITQAATIIGYLRAQSTNFQGPLILGAQKATFTTSKLKSITIRKDDTYKGKQVIELKQGTIVDGPIIFEAGKGEVHVYAPSQVLGPVTGGKIIKKS